MRGFATGIARLATNGPPKIVGQDLRQNSYLVALFGQAYDLHFRWR